MKALLKISDIECKENRMSRPGKLVQFESDIIDKEFDKISESFCYMAGDFPRHFIERSETLVKNGVRFRIIFPKDLLDDLYPDFSDDAREKAEFKVLDDVNLLIDVNDRFGRMALPAQDGKVNHDETIFGHDLRLKRWCQDVFDHYWDIAKPFKPL